MLMGQMEIPVFPVLEVQGNQVTSQHLGYEMLMGQMELQVLEVQLPMVEVVKKIMTALPTNNFVNFQLIFGLMRKGLVLV
jgi:hypothetical protein